MGVDVGLGERCVGVRCFGGHCSSVWMALEAIEEVSGRGACSF